jgi:hypothetical protein
MDELLRFVTREGVWEPDLGEQISLTDNFGNVVTHTQRLPGISGGFDEYGDGPAPSEVGNVQAFQWVEERYPDLVAAKLDEWRGISSWGAGRLYKRVMGNDNDVRWTEARVSSLPLSQNAGEKPHVRQRIQMSFQAHSPFWYKQGTAGPEWGDGVATWGDGVTYWGGSEEFVELTGTVNEIYRVQNGYAPSPVRIDLRVPAGESAENVVVQRLVFGEVMDEIAFTETLVAADRLIVDSVSSAVTLNGADAFDERFAFYDPRWFVAMPGTNTIRVGMTNVTDVIEIRLLYYEAFKK